MSASDDDHAARHLPQRHAVPVLPRLRAPRDPRSPQRRAGFAAARPAAGRARQRHRLLGPLRSVLRHQRLPRPARPQHHLRHRHQAGAPGPQGHRDHGRRRHRHRRRAPAERRAAQHRADRARVQQLQLRHDRRPALDHDPVGGDHLARRRAATSSDRSTSAPPWRRTAPATCGAAPASTRTCRSGSRRRCTPSASRCSTSGSCARPTTCPAITRRKRRWPRPSSSWG